MSEPLDLQQVHSALRFLDLNFRQEGDEIRVGFANERTKVDFTVEAGGELAALEVQAVPHARFPATQRVDLLEAISDAGCELHSPQCCLQEHDDVLVLVYSARLAIGTLPTAALTALLTGIFGQVLGHCDRVLEHHQQSLASLAALAALDPAGDATGADGALGHG